MNDQQKITGGCLCGAVRYQASGQPLWACHCHCSVCQRQTGSAFSTFVGFPSDCVTWPKGKPALYQSSELIQRGFCARCGSTLSFHRAHVSELSVTAGSLDHPDSVDPQFHMMTSSQVSWLKVNDGLPCHHRFPPDGNQRDVGL